MLKAVKNQKWKIKGNILSFKAGSSLESLPENIKKDAIRLGYAIETESKVFNPVQENKAIQQVDEKKEELIEEETEELVNVEEILSEEYKKELIEDAIEEELPDEELENIENLLLEVEAEEKDKDKLIAIAKEYGIDVDGRSSLKTIKTKIIEILK